MDCPIRTNQELIAALLISIQDQATRHNLLNINDRVGQLQSVVELSNDSKSDYCKRALAHMISNQLSE